MVKTDPNSERVAPCYTPDSECLLVRLTAAGSPVHCHTVRPPYIQLYCTLLSSASDCQCAGTRINFVVSSQAIYSSIISLPLPYKLNAFSVTAIQHDKQCIQKFAPAINGYRALYQWVKLPVREADHSPPPTSKLYL